MRGSPKLVDFLRRWFVLFSIDLLAGFQAYADRFGEQRRRDLWSGRSGPFEFSDQCGNGLIESTAGRAIHFFSNLSEAELMQ